MTVTSQLTVTVTQCWPAATDELKAELQQQVIQQETLASIKVAKTVLKWYWQNCDMNGKHACINYHIRSRKFSHGTKFQLRTTKISMLTHNIIILSTYRLTASQEQRHKNYNCKVSVWRGGRHLSENCTSKNSHYTADLKYGYSRQNSCLIYTVCKQKGGYSSWCNKLLKV